MAEEKTIDELKAELEQLRKQNLEMELEMEKQKLEEAKKLEEQKKEEELREKIRQELLEELESKSVVKNDTTPETLTTNETNERWATFSEHYKKALGLKGMTYEDICEKVANRL